MTRSLPTLTLVLAACAVGAPAVAQSVDGPQTSQATFQGLAPGACIMGAPLAPSTDNAEVGALSPGSADVTITELVDEDGEIQSATIILQLPAVCNQAHTLGLGSLNGGLLSDGPAPTSDAFRSLAPYQVTVDWSGVQQVFDTQTGALVLPVDGAATGDVSLTIQIPPGGAPLTAGVYSDQLVIELGVAG